MRPAAVVPSGRDGCLVDHHSEVKKYRHMYAVHNYRMGKRNRLQAERDIATMEAGLTYLDVGCGLGEAVRAARARGLIARGIEIVPELCAGQVLLGSILNIPFDRVDYVTCYDVLEHLHPDEVDAALDNLWRVTRDTLFITTNDRESVRDGYVLHRTRRPQAWWQQQFDDRGYTEIVCQTFATEGDWHWRIRM